MHLAALLLVFVLQPPDKAGTVGIPATDRPANFSGAAGVYTMQMQAAPTAVRIEDPVILTVKIISQEPGPWLHPPDRDKLKLLPPELGESFFIEPQPELDRAPRGDRTWEFVWRLVPRHAGVKAIPALEFVYYHTAEPMGFKAAEGGQRIALEVEPRPGLLVAVPPLLQERFRTVHQGSALLTRSRTGAQQLAWLAAGLALPPVLCVMLYVLWRRLFPDAAAQLRRRRGRGLRTALGRLRRLGPAAPAAEVRAVVADYLRLHIELPPGGPTPGEVKQALAGRGLAGKVIAQAEEFVRACDVALFALAAPEPAGAIKSSAAQLIEDLENELCSASRH